MNNQRKIRQVQKYVSDAYNSGVETAVKAMVKGDRKTRLDKVNGVLVVEFEIPSYGTVEIKFPTGDAEER